MPLLLSNELDTAKISLSGRPASVAYVRINTQINVIIVQYLLQNMRRVFFNRGSAEPRGSAGGIQEFQTKPNLLKAEGPWSLKLLKVT